MVTEDEPLPLDATVAFARALTLLREVAAGDADGDRIVSFYTPAPTLAMSRWESRRPGFQAASSYAQARGFQPAVRPTGGRAAAYDRTCLAFDLVIADDGSVDPRPVFAETSERMAEMLRAWGLDARVGPVPGEYCPGEFSVNLGGKTKLVGTSQRAIRGARLLSGMIPLGDVRDLVDVVGKANDALGLKWDPRTFGTLAETSVRIERDVLESSLRSALSPVADEGLAVI